MVIFGYFQISLRKFSRSGIFSPNGHICGCGCNSPVHPKVKVVVIAPSTPKSRLLAPLHILWPWLAFSLLPLHWCTSLDFVCTWEWLIWVCLSSGVDFVKICWALDSSPRNPCCICYSWWLRTPRRLGVNLETPICLWYPEGVCEGWIASPKGKIYPLWKEKCICATSRG